MVVQAALLALTAFSMSSFPAAAAPDCRGVADAMKAMESNVTAGWAEKNAGGQEESSRMSARAARDAFLDGPPMADFKACLNRDGTLHFLLILSKTNSLSAALALTSTGIRQSLSFQHYIAASAKPLQTVNPIYWRAINADTTKIERRYADVTTVERQSAEARRQAIFDVTHGRATKTQAYQLATIDAKLRAGPRRLAPHKSTTVQGCSRPNVQATTLRPAEPDTPPAAQEQGISGTVQVVVSLDADSKVVGARIQTSPSRLLNEAALAAARQSSFQTEIRDCKPISADYIYSVEFSSQ